MYRIKESWTLKQYTTVFKGNFPKSLDDYEFTLQYLIEFLGENFYELKAYTVLFDVIDKSIQVMLSIKPAGKGNDAVEIDAELLSRSTYKIMQGFIKIKSKQEPETIKNEE